MGMSASEAGRKGGLSRSAKKLAAAKKNGFQPSAAVSKSPEPEAPAESKATAATLLIPALPPKEQA